MIKNIGITLIIISLIPIIISIIYEKRSFFNLKSVIIKHYAMFKTCKSQMILFIGTPLVLSIGLAMIYDSTKLFYDNLSVIISIVLSMLFAVLAILTNYDYSKYQDEKKKERIQNVVTETINSIVFETYICVLLLLYGMIMIIVSEVCQINNITSKVFTGIACFLFSVLLLDLLIVIKRVSKIMTLKIKEGDQDP